MSGSPPGSGKTSPSPPSRPPVRVRVGGGYVFHHDPRAIDEATIEESNTHTVRASLADKDSKILRLQTRLAGMKDRVAELEQAMAAAAETHAAEISIMRSRVESMEVGKRRAVQQQEKSQQELESLQIQQQAQQTQQRHLLEDAQAAGWQDGFHANAGGMVAQAQAEVALADAQLKLDEGQRRAGQVAEELALSERQRAHELRTASAVQEELLQRCEQWQARAERAERAAADAHTQSGALREALREALTSRQGGSPNMAASRPISNNLAAGATSTEGASSGMGGGVGSIGIMMSCATGGGSGSGSGGGGGVGGSGGGGGGVATESGSASSSPSVPALLEEREQLLQARSKQHAPRCTRATAPLSQLPHCSLRS